MLLTKHRAPARTTKQLLYFLIEILCEQQYFNEELITVT